jgi:RimJ/RimL family protein N-acetyltransferase
VTPEWPIETERLVLRLHEEGDLGALHELYGDEAVARWLYGGPESLEEAHARLGRYLARRELTADSGLSVAVTLRDGAYAGDLALWYSSFEDRGAEVAYAFLPRHQGNGYAVEAAKALLDWGFGPAGLHRVVARLEPRNAASSRVAERLGMRREGTFVENGWVKGQWSSEALYAILEREWQR